MVFLYPDLFTAVIGNFDPIANTLIQGNAAAVDLSFVCIQNDEYILSLHLKHHNEEKTIKDIQDMVAIRDTLTTPSGLAEIFVEFHTDFRQNQEDLIYFDAPTSKCIRLIYILLN